MTYAINVQTEDWAIRPTGSWSLSESNVNLDFLGFNFTIVCCCNDQ